MKTILALLSILLFVSGCGKKSPSDLMNAAQKDYAAKKYVEAVKNYEAVVEEYPESEAAPEALMKIAMVYQAKKIPNINAEESLKKSSSYYREIYDKYPQSSNAPRALFMSAFILANELQKYDEAKKIYELFIKKYPKHELVTSAKEEIKYMGLPPEKIIEKNKNKNS